MIIITKITSPTVTSVIEMGRQGENEAREVWFDLTWLIENYGEGTATVLCQRSRDDAPYLATITQEGKNAIWRLTSLDTAYDGYGKCELRWTVGETLAKTIIYKTVVLKSMAQDAEVPDPYQSWYDALIEYIDENSISPEDLADAVAEYIAEHPIESPVMSVNSKTGNVVLDAEDVGALPDSTVIPSKVSDLQNDSGFGTYSKPSGGIPKTDLASGVQASLDKADSALQTAPVTSVNNKTGAVTLNASDVGAGTYSKPSGGIPKTDLASAVQTSLGKADSAYQKPSGGIPSTDMSSAVQTSLGKADTALQTAPVSSVNTKTGAVSLDAGDIGYDDSETYASGSVGAELSSLSADLTEKLDAPSTAGTNGQVLTSDGQGGQSWQTPQSGGSVSPYTSNPAALGTASAGSSDDYARGDHVHPMPSAANVGAIALPVSPSSGDFLVYNGSAWTAQSLSTWSGGNY